MAIHVGSHIPIIRLSTSLLLIKFINLSFYSCRPEVISKAMILLLSEEPAEEDFMLVTGNGTKYLNLNLKI